MIYLDNCSTTHKKPKNVLRNIKKGLTTLNYNPGRSSYKKAIETNMEVFNLRQNACKIFKCQNPSNVIITKGCTESLNLAIQSSVSPHCHIITTIYEHNSVLRTLENAKETKHITYSILKPDSTGKISIESMQSALTAQTKIVIINHTSNVTGATQDLQEIGFFCKRHNLIFIVDAAQSAGHTTINMEQMNINFLAIAGHKGIFGPQGIGLLLCLNAKPLPLIYGGTGTFSSSLKQPLDVPEGIESGTLSISNILGLNAGLQFIEKNLTKINIKTRFLTTFLLNKLKQIPNIEIYSHKDSLGVISFNIKNLTSNQLSEHLDKYNIATRSGLHCAPKVHEYYNTTTTGMTRVGLSYFNNKKDITKLIRALQKISKQFN